MAWIRESGRTGDAPSAATPKASPGGLELHFPRERTKLVLPWLEIEDAFLESGEGKDDVARRGLDERSELLQSFSIGKSTAWDYLRVLRNILQQIRRNSQSGLTQAPFQIFWR